MTYQDILKETAAFLTESNKKENFTIQPTYWNATILANLVSKCIVADRRSRVTET